MVRTGYRPNVGTQGYPFGNSTRGPTRSRPWVSGNEFEPRNATPDEFGRLPGR